MWWLDSSLDEIKIKGHRKVVRLIFVEVNSMCSHEAKNQFKEYCKLDHGKFFADFCDRQKGSWKAISLAREFVEHGKDSLDAYYTEFQLIVHVLGDFHESL